MVRRARLVTWLALALAAGVSTAAAAPGATAPSATAPLAIAPSATAELVALPAAGVGAAVRDHVDVVWQTVPGPRRAAWQRLQAAAPGLDQVSWDAATGVPSRIWGRGVPAPGSVADGARALAAARAFLAAHLDLLAPGATVDDFVLVANELDGDLRTLGLLQRHRGLRVVGGQVSFRFKADRLFVVASEALPDVAVAGPVARTGGVALATRAYLDTVAELGLPPSAVTVGAPGEAAILPLVGRRGVLGYRVAVPVALDAGARGAWQVWSDPVSGAPLARQATTRFGTGTIAFDTVVRWPGRPRQVTPAPDLEVGLPSGMVTSSATGAVSWPGDGAVAASVFVRGARIVVDNLMGDEATTNLTVGPGQTAVWRPGEDRDLEAQLSAYVHVGVAAARARGFAGELPLLARMAVRVNLDSECNAFWDGQALTFFRASARCENTATIADVVYHEYGHALHQAAIIPGAGFFDGAFSEGLSDYLAATITDDPAMARGFFHTDEPLRHLDPVGTEAVWPRDLGEIHTTGLVFAGAMWDLRTALVARYGHDAGVARADRLYYAAVRRAANIPATLVEVLAAADDDGDLANGTPDECAIRAAFGRHGLRTTAGVIEAEGAVASSSTATHLRPTLHLTGLDARCGDTVVGVDLEWQPRAATDSPAAGSVLATPSGEGWAAEMPLPDDGDVGLYHFRVRYGDGSEQVFPDNRADPWLEIYRGDVVPLYCTDLERDPFAEGWRAGGEPGVWQWGLPGGSRGVGDPGVASSGTRALGMGLSSRDGGYPARAVSWIETPPIDVGRWSDVRLQYRRWLGVEDGFFDQALIEADGTAAWTNLTSTGTDAHNTHHEDRSWVFHDVPLSRHVRDHDVVVRWRLVSDEGYELGGWNLDDVCVVAHVGSVCGDGQLTGAEECDLGDGNRDVADVCRTTCREPTCGDGLVDTGEACDDGNRDNLDGCTDRCALWDPYADGGCSAGGGAGGPGALVSGLLVGGLVLRRRRRR